MAKYKLTWKDLTWNDFKIYLFGLFKAFIPKKKLSTLDDLENFIQTKSAWVSQVTLYGYLKTRMGTRYVLHFENDEFMKSVNLAKWNIYAVALQDLTFFTFSYLKANLNYQDVDKAKEIFLKILDDETTNNMPQGIMEDAKKNFEIVIKDYPKSDFAIDSEYKLELIEEILASKEMYLARYYIEREKWIPAINRYKKVLEDYERTIFIEEALHRLVELHYKIGMIDESKKYGFSAL